MAQQRTSQPSGTKLKYNFSEQLPLESTENHTSLCAVIKVLFPLDPIPKLAGYSHLYHRDPCLFPTALEPGSKRQATA